MKLVSQSEVDTFLICERRHFYAFGERLQPKSHGPGLTRGILGHRALAVYYKRLVRVKPTPEDIRQAASEMDEFLKNELLNAALSGDTNIVEMATELRTLLSEYVMYTSDEFNEWEILSVEQEFVIEDFPFTPDIIKRNRVSGEVVLSDHKFLYNFYNANKVNLFPQLPKYVGGLRDIGYRVDYAEYNMIRYRKDGVEKFKRMRMDIPEVRIEKYQHEQEVVKNRINSFKAMSMDEWEQLVLRTANSFTCNSCPFFDLCQTDLDNLRGRDLLVHSDYEPSTYGYRDPAEEAG